MKCTKANNEMKSMNNIYIYRHVISKYIYYFQHVLAMPNLRLRTEKGRKNSIRGISGLSSHNLDTSTNMKSPARVEAYTVNATPEGQSAAHYRSD